MSATLDRAEIRKAEKFVMRAAVGCIDKQGFSFRIASEEIARTYFINETAFALLERAVARLKQARKRADRGR